MNRNRVLSAVMAATLAFSAPVTVYAANGAVTTDEVSEREQTNSEISKNLATQGMVLLQNNNAVLPLAKGGNIALFGTGGRQTVKGGTGSGDVNQRETVNVEQGLQNMGYTVTTGSYLDAYDAAQEAAEAEGSSSWWSSVRAGEIEITDEMMAEASADTDTAIYVLGRNAGEGADRTDTEGDYELDENEIAALDKITAAFDKVIVIINAGGAVDTKYIRGNEGIDSILVMGQAGQRGGDALAEILTGDVTPSGKLAATWPENYSDLPLSDTWGANDGNVDQEDYTDGIYVGYRYYDSFNVTPAYAFGYGLSYTTFETVVDSVEADADKVTVTATVTNTGDTYSGKEVVQVYFSAPDGELEKPYQELAAFGKTDELAPGESQTLTISYNTAEMSSYSEDRAAYILDGGDYVIRVGNSSRSTTAAAVIRLDELAVTEQLSNQLAQDKEIEELSSADVESYSYEGEADEIAAAPVIELAAADIVTVDNASPYDDEVVASYVSATTETEYLQEEGATVSGKYHDHPDYTEEVVELEGDFSASTLKDVYDGTITMEEFVSGLTMSQMADIVIGGNKLPTANGQSAGAASANSEDISDGTMIGAQANAVAGAAGETAGIYIEDKAIPNIVLADGPAGLRITQQEERDDGNTYYQYCTAFPSGTVMTQTWDTEAMTEFGEAVGTELEEYGITLWLAPGMNIQKDPLCGRNFEYYSEDPYLAGMMGIAETTGVQSHPGIGVTIKHFYGNNQEDNRNAVNNTISERASREIYLKQFEMVVKGAQPMAIMSSYNVNNSIPDADDYDLLTNVTRGEWGFDGLIMTDWGGGQSTPSISMHAGNDLIMPGSSVDDITIRGFIDEEPTFGEDDIYPTVTIGQGWFGLNASTAWGEFVLSADGDVTIEKTVATADYEAAVRPGIDENGEETEVAVADLIAQLGDCATVTTDGDTTTITYTGSYKDNNITLGDVQKSVANILKVVMASDQFATLFDDVEAESWTQARADKLVSYQTVEK